MKTPSAVRISPPILMPETAPGDNPPLNPEELLELLAAGVLLADEDTGVDVISLVL
jgi:hypothetical protein